MQRNNYPQKREASDTPEPASSLSELPIIAA
jgi:hypothetical protein